MKVKSLLNKLDRKVYNTTPEGKEAGLPEKLIFDKVTASNFKDKKNLFYFDAATFEKKHIVVDNDIELVIDKTAGEIQTRFEKHIIN